MSKIYAVNEEFLTEDYGDEPQRVATFYSSKAMATAHIKRGFVELCDAAAAALTDRFQWELLCDALYRDDVPVGDAGVRHLKSWGLDIDDDYRLKEAVDETEEGHSWRKEFRLIEIEVGSLNRKEVCALLHSGGAFFGFQHPVASLLVETEVVWDGGRTDLQRTDLVTMTGRKTFSARPGGGHHPFRTWG